MRDDDWGPEDSAMTHLNAKLEEIPSAPHIPRSLCELLYTADETGIIDAGCCPVNALKIWKIVELAKSLGDNCPQELRM